MKTPEERAKEITDQFWIDQKASILEGSLDLDAMIAQAIREAVEAAAPRWIPVGERLPDWLPGQEGAGNVYQVVFKSCATGRPVQGFAEIDQLKGWVDPDDGLARSWCDGITHWMEPLPLPVG